MNVLLTKRLSQDQLDLIHSWGWSCEVVETLKITLLEVKEVPKDSEAWIVSSRNSFAVVKKFINEAPQRIYCVGVWMKNEIEKLSTKVSVKNVENMKALVSDLAKENFKEVIYFCGREHRQELEEGLGHTETKITKVFTHESEMAFPVIKKSFDAVFVFSPRSAESLLGHNQFSTQTIFACIGSTTAAYLNKRGLNNTFIASYPDSRKLIEEFRNSLPATLSGQTT